MSSTRKLAIVISSLGPGGAERVAVKQAIWFADQGSDVTLITLDGSVKDHYEPDHSKITRVHLQDNSSKLLFNYIKDNGFDLTIDHLHWDEQHFDFFEMMGGSNHRLVIFDHSTYFYPLYFQSKWSLFETRAAAYKNADAVSVLSRHTCQMFRQNVPATAFIPNPLSYESEAVAPVLETTNIIAVANWQRPEKRLDRILEIFSAVAEQVPDSQLILVGPFSQSVLHGLVDQYQLEPEQVEAVGQQDDVEPFYLRSRVLLHTSELEGFGLVLTEAGLHGLPRVAMQSPGLDEVIEHGVDGYLVEQGDTKAAVDYLVSLVTDDQLCQRMSDDVLGSTQKFSLQNIGQRWDWLANLIAGSSSAAAVEAAISQDCSEQGVDEVSIKCISQDYDNELLRLVHLFQKGGLTTAFSAESLRHSDLDSSRVYRSVAARILSDVSEWFESRYVAKLIRQSGLFDRRWYTERYPDVGSGRIDPALHYVKFGATEGRNPSDHFDTLHYLSRHRNLVFKKENPLLHFMETKTPDMHAREVISGRNERTTASVSKKHSWSDEDQAWLDKFTNNNKLLTLLEPNFLGIKQSASQFVAAEQMLFLNDDMDDSTIDYYVRLIGEADPEKILLQGFPQSYLKLIRRVRKMLPDILIFCIYHGSFTQQQVPVERRCLQTLIELHREGVLNRIGVVKEGMAETLQAIGVDSHFVMNFIAKIPEVPARAERVSVGIVGSAWQPRKPLHHQIAACKHLAYDEIKIIGSDKSVVQFCELFKITATHFGALPQNKLPIFLAGNTINLYVTLSECAPMLPLESLAEGVPCLFGPNNHYFSDHPYLRSRLVVDIPDSETRIARFAQVAIDERQEIITEYRKYAKKYNIQAMNSFETFLEN